LKWDESSPYYKIKTRPTTLSEEMQKKVGEWSCRLFKRIDCRDYARFDWRLDAQGNPRLLEANPNCGWCWDGHLPKTASLAGISYAQFFEIIMKSAADRAVRKYEEQLKNANKAYVQVGRNGAEAFYQIP
jgi:D-alanine-D-alanine ligase